MNITNLTDNSNNLLKVVENLNDLSNGDFFVLLLLSLFISVLLFFPNYDFSKLLILDGFITSLVAFIGFILGFIGWGYMILPLLVLMGATIYYKLNN